MNAMTCSSNSSANAIEAFRTYEIVISPTFGMPAVLGELTSFGTGRTEFSHVALE